MTFQGVPIAVFIAFWMWGVLRVVPRKGKPFADFESTIPWLFIAFGMLFVLQAFYLLFGHYIRSWLEWKNVEYALTNQRMVFRSGWLKVHERSLPLNSLVEGFEVRKLRAGGVGDIVFQKPEQPKKPKHFGEIIQQMFNPELQNEGLGFYAVEHVQDVYRLIATAATDVRK